MTPTTDCTNQPDTAAVFACAMSLWQSCEASESTDQKINLSDAYSGMDQLMREVMRIGRLFEEWACQHVEFAELNDVWPYMLRGRFGDACLACLSATELEMFDDSDCLRVAIQLALPIKLVADLHVPVEVTADLQNTASTFRSLRIHTVRETDEGDDVLQFTSADDPFDEEFGNPYFGLYGVEQDGLLEHIADRRTYAEAVLLAQKLFPAATFPATPCIPASHFIDVSCKSTNV